MFNKLFSKEDKSSKEVSIPSGEELKALLLQNGVSSEELSKIDLSEAKVMKFDNAEQAMAAAKDLENKKSN